MLKATPTLATDAGPVERAAFVRSFVPEGGLFDGKEWRVAPNAFALSDAHIQLIERLGRVLHKFNLAANLLYRQSVQGKQPAWIAALLDAGKPPELVAIARDRRLKGQLPAVIRPDLILTADGFALSELDSVPGGIGLTAWLNETYAALGEPVLGGAQGMRDGFASIFPEGHCLIAEEAADYRPEMEYLLGPDRVHEAESYRADGTPIYRFFEGFDWMNLSPLRESWEPGQPMTPPLKPYLEEKLLLALFWSRPLRAFWRQHLTDKGVRLLEQVIPYSWVVDPAPLPPHAVIPGLDIQRWEEMTDYSQKQRELVLKVSGFSEQAWGARGVWIGSDMPGEEWTARVREALEAFAHQPRVLQRFTKGAVVSQDWVDPDGRPHTLEGRARVSPYYFSPDATTAPTLGGALVTLCPKDKKLLHGMSDAVISPGK